MECGKIRLRVPYLVDGRSLRVHSNRMTVGIIVTNELSLARPFGQRRVDIFDAITSRDQRSSWVGARCRVMKVHMRNKNQSRHAFNDSNLWEGRVSVVSLLY
jgi:hypothetical protein